MLQLGHGYNIADGRPQKLKEQRTGLFKIVEHIGYLVYRLDLEGLLNIYPVVLIAQLCLVEKPLEPPTAINTEAGYQEVDKILDTY